MKHARNYRAVYISWPNEINMHLCNFHNNFFPKSYLYLIAFRWRFEMKKVPTIYFQFVLLKKKSFSNVFENCSCYSVAYKRQFIVFFITHHLNVDNKAYAINNPNCLVTFIKRYMKLSLLQTYHHILFLASVVYIHEDSDQSRCHTHHLLCTDHTKCYNKCRSNEGGRLYIKK